MLPSMTRRQALTVLGVGAAIGLAAPGGPAAVAAEPLPAAETPFAALRARRLAVLVGTYDTADPDLRSILDGQAAEARGLWASMDRTPARATLWADRASTADPSHTRVSYDRLRIMASAFASPGTDLHRNPELGADLVAAMDWLYEYRYNPGAPKVGNWWEWEIGTPLRLNDCCVLLRDELGAERVARYTGAVTHFAAGKMPIYTGANLVWTALVAAMSGANAEDPALLEMVRTGVGSLFPYVDHGDGFYRDGSFVQHEFFAYTGGYGSSLLLYLSDLLHLVAGSQWDITDPARGNVANWVFDSYDPVLFRGAMMDMVRGREASRYYTTDRVAGHTTLGAILNIAGSITGETRDRMFELVKGHLSADTYRSFFLFDTKATERTRVGTAALAKSVLVDPAVAARDDLVGHRVFAGMDRAVHLRSDFALGIAMVSARSRNYESINKENMRAWYTADGMTYLYNHDLAHYSEQYWSTVDPYRLPGTTVDTRARDTVSIQDYWKAYQPTSRWAGGSQLDGFGAVGMELDAEGSTLTARKSWFCVDDEVICLGAGISSSDGRTIETILENRKLSDAAAALVVDGESQPRALGWSADIPDVSWAHLDGVGGYVLLEPGTVRAKRETRTGAWFDFNQQVNNDRTPYSRDYVTLWLDHGASPTDGSYAYVLLPGASELATRAYAAIAPHLRVVANTPDVQAVRVLRRGLVAANFWASSGGTADRIAVDRPCSVVLTDIGRKLRVAVADPTQALTGAVTVTVDTRVRSMTAVDERVALTRTRPLMFTVDLTGAAGGSVVAEFAR